MPVKTTRKPRIVKAPETNLFNTIKDYHYANEDAMAGFLVQSALMDPTGMVGLMLAHSVVRAAVQVLRLEIPIGGNSDADIDRARTQYTKALAAAKRTLGDKFPTLYAEALRGHNECARANLDNFNGGTYTYVIPAFNDDGTHAPLGPRDYPWNV